LLSTALTKDPEYDWAYGLLADLAYRKARSLENPDEKTQYLLEAAENYEKAIGFINPYEPQNLFTYKISLASIFSELGLRQKAIEAFTSAGQSAPSVNEKWQIEEAIAQEYIALQDFVNARISLQNALALAPEDQVERLQQALNQISGAP
jgi:tetratricopeptide (TPR) repeat protein